MKYLKHYVLAVIVHATFGFSTSLSAGVLFPFTYVDKGSTITITGYSNDPGPVNIPATINGKPVTEIEVSAFYNYFGITEVNLPSTVTSLAPRIFEGRRLLKKVTSSGGLTSIGAYAFAGCDQLISVSLPPTVSSIGDGAFGGCPRLTDFPLPNGLTYLGMRALVGSAISQVTIPTGLTSYRMLHSQDVVRLKT